MEEEQKSSINQHITTSTKPFPDTEKSKRKRVIFSILFLTISLLLVFVFISLGSKPHEANSKAHADTVVPDEDSVSESIDSEEPNVDFMPQSEATTNTTTTNPITIENQNPGSTSWTMHGSKISSDSNNEIKGYASKVSINKGERIDFKVTVNPAQNFTMDFYRTGWYQGLGARLMKTVGPISGIKQSKCPVDSTTGMVECNWITSYTLTTPTDWTSGAYLVKIKNSNGYANWINFTLRDDNRKADILFQNSVNTWEAYNYWGGKSFYLSTIAGPKAVKVSFDRPYLKSGTRLTSWELSMIHWIEANGYNVAYSTNLDTSTNPERLLNYKAFLSIGHDEYWTWAMRNAVEDARDKGVNIGFFGGNDSYWQIRYEPSSTGIPNRVIVGYKEAYTKDPYYQSSDPAKKRKTTALFRYSFINRPEQLMMGGMYARNVGEESNDIDYTVTNASKWVYSGTGLSNGDTVKKIVGHEYDKVFSSYPKPANTSFTILAKTFDPAVNSHANTTIYTAPSGAMVFDAGTTSWNYGLDSFGQYGKPNPGIQKITANILNRFVGITPTPN